MLPIQDPAAIVCSLDEAGMADRLKEFEHLFSATLVSHEREPAQLRLVLAVSADGESAVRDLFAREAAQGNMQLVVTGRAAQRDGQARRRREGMGDLDQGSCRDDPGCTCCRIGQRQGTDREPKAIGSGQRQLAGVESQQNARQNRPGIVGCCGEDHLVYGRLEHSTIDLNADRAIHGCRGGKVVGWQRGDVGLVPIAGQMQLVGRWA